MISTFKGYFLGKRKMIITGGMQVLEQILKLVFSLLCATFFVRFGMVYAVCGTILGVTISEIITLLVVTSIYFCNRKKFTIQISAKVINKKCNKSSSNFCKTLKSHQKRNLSIKFALKNIFKFGVFVSLEACIMPLTGAVDSILIVPLLLRCGLGNVVSYTLFGLEDGIVASLVAMPTVFASSLGTSLIPNIKTQNMQKTSKDISESIKYVWLIALASCFVFMFFSKEIVNFLYAGGLSDKVVYEFNIVQDLVKLNAFNIIYLSMLNLSTSIMHGLGDSKSPVLNMLFCAIVRIVVLTLSISTKIINIYGVAIADMAFYALAFLLNLRKIKQKVNLQYSVSKLFVLPAMSCVIMCLTMKLFSIVLSGLLSPRNTTLIMGVMGIAVYVFILFVTKVLDFKSLKNNILKKTKKSNAI